jgi:hypothetical protein
MQEQSAAGRSWYTLCVSGRHRLAMDGAGPLALRAGLAAFCALAPAGGARGAVLSECPALAPVAWHIGRARLDAADVLSYRPGEKIDESALPLVAPTSEQLGADVLQQDWDMGALVAVGEVQQLWCRYAHSDQILKLPDATLRHCRQTITHFSRTHPDPRSVRRMACD